jgi:hypothetical protein
VVLDGYSAYGASPNTAPFLSPNNAQIRVECDFHLLPANSNPLPLYSGINLFGTSDCIIKGLSLHSISAAWGSQFNFNFSNSSNSVLEGSYIGLKADGSNPSSYSMLSVGGGGNSNTIGGINSSSLNVIGGNNIYDAMQIGGSGNIIIGNYIGTDLSGNIASGVSYGGINNSGQNKIINNLISGNGSVGILLQLGASYSEVRGNYIGIKADLSGGLPNGQSGIKIIATVNNATIGGLSTGEPNTIANNGNLGIEIDGNGGAAGNIISGNSIYNNANGGILLYNSGNYEKPAPAIISAYTNAVSGTTIQSGDIV